MEETLIEKIHHIVKSARLSDNINDGGCAYFARFAYEQLTKKGYEVIICISDMSETKLDMMNGRYASFNHVFLKIGNLYFDGKALSTSYKGVAYTFDSRPSKEGMKYEYLKKITPVYTNPYGWNADNFSVWKRIKLRSTLNKLEEVIPSNNITQI